MNWGLLVLILFAGGGIGCATWMWWDARGKRRRGEYVAPTWGPGSEAGRHVESDDPQIETALARTHRFVLVGRVLGFLMAGLSFGGQSQQG